MDLDSVAESRGGRERPAGSAIDGNVLVSLVGKEVSSIDISPPVICGQINNGNVSDGRDPVLLEVVVVDVALVHRDVDCGVGEDQQEGKEINSHG